MTSWRWLPRSRKGCIRAIGLVLILALPAIYLILLSAERYSAWQASRMLDRLERLRIGDQAADFERAVQGCEIEKTGGEYKCELIAGAFRFRPPWMLMGKLPFDQYYQLDRFLARMGLRRWQLRAAASIHDGRIESASTHLLVVGRYETLGAHWRVAPRVPSEYLQINPRPDEQRTLFHWFHITSLPPGQGFTIDATADSTQKELLARRINRRCLFSFRGCDGLCEVLPDAVPVLRERGRDWGGWTDAPKSKCEIK